MGRALHRIIIIVMKYFSLNLRQLSYAIKTQLKAPKAPY